MKPRLHFVLSAISGLFIFLFIYTATGKLFNLRFFQATLSKSPLLETKSHFLSFAVPVSELIVSGMLLFNQTRKAGLIGSLILMTAFTLYIAYMLFYIPHLPCSCGGVLGSMSWQTHLLFNAFFLGLAVLGLLLYQKINFRPLSAKSDMG